MHIYIDIDHFYNAFNLTFKGTYFETILNTEYEMGTLKQTNIFLKLKDLLFITSG